MTKLFFTGGTGYIGGDALHVLATTYPDLEITALARNSDKGAKIASQFPTIKLIYGDLDSTELLTSEAAKADIVVHTADADHVGAANAIVAGLVQKTTPGYFIHTSGTGIVASVDHERKTFGVLAEKKYDDWEGIGEMTSLPDSYAHRNVDKVVLAAAEKNPGKIFTAVVCPPTIYGPGRGPDKQRSIQVPDMTKATLKRGKGFQVGEGKNIWTEVHVQDLSEVFLALVTAALQPDGGKATWNDQGYYFAENGEFVWGDIAQKIAKIAADKKLIETAELDNVDYKEADGLRGFGSYLWGTNSRCKALRANKLFGWTPKQKSLVDTLPDLVEAEAKALGLVKGHAEKAAGDA
ncbi:NAD dependent epimerase/dehydratase family protein [Lentithecium fluviatile CBS 122367]|uniref:NAD dependent epimerase/dehydratase family protein n=1 Tax=Lentithecium fluviatile CBS 122367 TaxID=1168545 RepID=A0A6G1IRV4_9PLEO|nr:NAD dependent epimerase/dehydratase family protein [Lentithecium fluviatile CBS 122367]